ncbi:inorganic triphosphatase [Conservatibacter flavescens]|uniref:Inorganic triphosphatase n=1 Tax=Conservatibacter flavescens TaxID=28161 RepID=A0A2M8S0T3_9PAST|nr:CYTH domain-containing protein [Conservatibacter flavescens]PJG84747.1 inorganic triphosphatase [Conservatibacter flavescens]
MSHEIELKLAIDHHFADFLSQEMTGFRVLAQKQVMLENCYYDTVNQFFAKQKMGLRVRSEENEHVLTLKTHGKIQGGLHIRPEYNVVLDSAQPQLEKLKRFTELEAFENIDLNDLQQQLYPIFRTDFQRQFWHIQLANGAEIEVALDQGDIVAGEKVERICEAEFELKSGVVDDLLTFVEGLSLVDGVRVSSISKAQRGYKLANPQLQMPIDWIARWRQLIEHEKSAVNPEEKLTALFQHEQQLIEDTINLDKTTITQNFVKTVERVGAFFNLYFHYVEHGKWFEQLLVEKLEKQAQDGSHVRLDREIVEQLIESNERLLKNVKNIIQQHSEQKDNDKALAQLIEMVQVGSYVHRMIGLIRLTM